MTSQSRVDLTDALASVRSGGLKEKQKGLQSLRYALRCRAASSKIKEPTFLEILDTLLEFASKERQEYLGLQSGTATKSKTTLSASAARLTSCAATLRVAVGVGSRNIRSKSVRLIVEHITESLVESPEGECCRPLLVDYARALSVVLSHEPHAEHLSQQHWKEVTSFCVARIQSTIDTDDALGASILSVRSSRSTMPGSQSRANSTMPKEAVHDFVSSLRCLTSVSYAPLVNIDLPVLNVMAQFLNTSSSAGRPQIDALTVINNILQHMRTEHVTLTKDFTTTAVTLAKSLWASKTPAIKDGILVMLVLLHPYIEVVSQTTKDTLFLVEVENLAEAIKGEYLRRNIKDQLQLHHLSLRFSKTKPQNGLQFQMFSLREGFSAGENVVSADHSWTLMRLLALLSVQGPSGGARGSRRSESPGTGPQKRQRTFTWHDNLLLMTSDPSSRTKVCSFQLICFVMQLVKLDEEVLGQYVEKLAAFIGDDDSLVASWASVALASCTNQASARMDSLTNQWASIWRLASRAVNPSTTCRAACHLLHGMLRAELVERTVLVNSFDSMLSSFAVNGPTVFCDSSSNLLKTFILYLRRSNTPLSNERTEQILTWIFRSWSPSNFHDRIYAAQSSNVEIVDVLSLVNICLGVSEGREPIQTLTKWSAVGQAWILHEQTRSLLEYLLLKGNIKVEIQKRHESENTSGIGFSLNSVTASLVLGLCMTETNGAIDKWANTKAEGGGYLDQNMVRIVSMLVVVGLCLGSCMDVKDVRRAEQLRTSTEKLSDLLFRDLSDQNSEQAKVDALIDVFAHHMIPHRCDETLENDSKLHRCMASISSRLLALLERRRETTQSDSLLHRNDASISDMMDFDTDFESQRTIQPVQTQQQHLPRTTISTNHSLAAQRAGVTVYAKLMHLYDNPSMSESIDGGQTESFLSSVLELPIPDFLAAGSVLSMLPHYGLQLHGKQFEPLLEFFADKVLQSYEYERAETNIALLLDLMTSFIASWTDTSDSEFYEFGLQLYKWFTVTALKANMLSASVQQRLIELMLRLLQIDAEYGQSDGLKSIKTTLFRVINQGSLTVKHFAAQHVSSIFSLFSLHTHEDVLEDLRLNLPTDVEWVEGIAVRILVLSNIASDWHSLRKQCIYHIFDTAAAIPDAEGYATACVSAMSQTLKLQSARDVFHLFSPQLLYSWLEEKTMEQVPYLVFDYENMVALLQHNTDEIYSQLLMRGRDDGIRWLTECLKLTEDKIMRSAFSKAAAYTISWDIITEGANPTSSEDRLRGLFKTSGDYYALIKANFPDIIAQMFNSTFQEQTVERGFEKRPEYHYAKEALAAMKGYGSSDKELSQAQQPRFKARYLVDQVERAYRRTGLNKDFSSVHEFLDVPGASVALRSIVDSMHPFYGPVHACQVVRKIRIFIALAGDVVFEGYPLQILIRTLQPAVVDPHCSDDAMGILRYLLERGRDFLSQKISMLTGTTLLTLLSMKQFMNSRQDKTTQESQFRATVSKMASFHEWLGEHLMQYQRVFRHDKQRATFGLIVQACRDLELPVSADANQPASTMLKGLFDDENTRRPILDSAERNQVISTLCRSFDVSESAIHDVFASDSMSLSYGRRVWSSTQVLRVADGYRVWAAKVLGRAYVSTVSLEHLQPMTGLIGHLAQGGDEKGRSKRAIVTKLRDLLSSDNRTYVGIAEQTLRKISSRFVALKDAEGSIEFEQLLPSHIVTAVCKAYGKDAMPIADSQKYRKEDFWSAVKYDSSKTFEDWAQTLAIAVCRWAQDKPIVGQLSDLFFTVHESSWELLPYIIHLALESDSEKSSMMRTYMSESLTTHFQTPDIETDRKSRLLLETLLYLLTQPIAQEKTCAARLIWLDIDYLVAAEAASRCNMPTAALYLGEIGAVPDVEPRHSRRSSISPSPAKLLSNELLLSIYDRVDDPDSFYGVSQPPSLESVLARVHHEGDGMKGLMLHSARMDASLRKSGDFDEKDSFGMMGSLGAMNLNSLTHDLLTRRGNQSNTATTDTMFEAARKLEQWDLSPPQKDPSSTSMLYGVFRTLSTASNLDGVRVRLNEALKLSIEHLQNSRLDATTVRATLSGIAVLNEVDELTSVRCAADLSNLWDLMQTRQESWDIGRFHDAQSIVSYRETLFSLLSQNKHLREALHVSIRDCRTIQARAVISSSQFARKNDLIQQSLTAATYLSQLVPVCKEIDVKTDAAAQFEVASTLWRQGETSTSVQMLQELCNRTDLLDQSVKIGRAGMLAQLGHEIAEARLEKPEDVISNYLRPAIEQLDKATRGSEAGRVYHEFASFCDQQLQDPGNVEDFQRLTRLRESKAAELEEYRNLSKEEKHRLRKQYALTQAWYKLDNEEYQKALNSRDQFVQQSLQNYMRALEVSDDFDAAVVRFFALWLENSDSDSANRVVEKYLPNIPSWKFVGLLNQETSRLQHDNSPFHRSLSELVFRICAEHPYHGVQYVYSTLATQPPANDQAAHSRHNAALQIARALVKDPKSKVASDRVFKISKFYQDFATIKIEDKKINRFKLTSVKEGKKLSDAVHEWKVPPATMAIELRPSADYSDIPTISSYRDDVRLAGGLSAPKVVVAIGSDGKEYKQLFKGGNDDLRQDAIMEQVFGEVSKMLQNHKASRQRNLHVRTYKVLPLSHNTGIIEFVPHSLPLGEYLVPAHKLYHPSDLSNNAAREKIGGAQGMNKESRYKVFRDVASRYKPVLRHFFFERFQDPDDWFQKRLNYTRSTATISILGHVLGLGDRHCHNILLDEKSGEAIHIDLGVAFEAGRVLPIPEVVPFRLTRDIVDAMGVTKTEGSFRRCCEFSLDALRAEKDGIMTLLNVLRYDPLYTWSVSPLKARRMQEQSGGEAGISGGGMRKGDEDDGGEAARALAVVEKKLSKTLSTAATVNELIQQATDERNLAVLFAGWAPHS